MAKICSMTLTDVSAYTLKVHDSVLILSTITCAVAFVGATTVTNIYGLALNFLLKVSVACLYPVLSACTLSIYLISATRPPNISFISVFSIRYGMLDPEVKDIWTSE